MVPYADVAFDVGIRPRRSAAVSVVSIFMLREGVSSPCEETACFINISYMSLK